MIGFVQGIYQNVLRFFGLAPPSNEEIFNDIVKTHGEIKDIIDDNVSLATTEAGKKALLNLDKNTLDAAEDAFEGCLMNIDGLNFQSPKMKNEYLDNVVNSHVKIKEIIDENVSFATSPAGANTLKALPRELLSDARKGFNACLTKIKDLNFTKL